MFVKDFSTIDKKFEDKKHPNVKKTNAPRKTQKLLKLKTQNNGWGIAFRKYTLFYILYLSIAYKWFLVITDFFVLI